MTAIALVALAVVALHGPAVHGHHHGRAILSQGYETYQGGPYHGRETICVPLRDAKADARTFERPDLPGYLCREVWR